MVTHDTGYVMSISVSDDPGCYPNESVYRNNSLTELLQVQQLALNGNKHIFWDIVGYTIIELRGVYTPETWSY